MIYSPPNLLDLGAISRETAAYRLFCKHPTQPHSLNGPTMGGGGWRVEKALDMRFHFFGSQFLDL